MRQGLQCGVESCMSDHDRCSLEQFELRRESHDKRISRQILQRHSAFNTECHYQLYIEVHARSGYGAKHRHQPILDRSHGDIDQRTTIQAFKWKWFRSSCLRPIEWSGEMHMVRNTHL